MSQAYTHINDANISNVAHLYMQLLSPYLSLISKMSRNKGPIVTLKPPPK